MCVELIIEKIKKIETLNDFQSSHPCCYFKKEFQTIKQNVIIVEENQTPKVCSSHNVINFK